MDTLKFTITNNAWINNGLARLIHEMERRFREEVSIKKEGNSVEFSSNTDEDIYFYLNDVINYLAAYGTYNFAQVFKLINKFLPNKVSKPLPYPQNEDDITNKCEISDADRKELKKYDKRSFSSKEQYWKMRISFLGSKSNYINWGLNFNTSSFSNKLKDNESKKNICPTCGNLSKNMIKVTQPINPFLNEHHNNEIDGISSNIRKSAKICPNCSILACISLFDKFIPFYRSDAGNVMLALPNIYDLDIIEKIINNLSLSSQFIDFLDPDVTSYNTNIKGFNNNNSNSAALLSLLNNILNNFSREPQMDFNNFSENELMDLVDWIFFNKESYKFYMIKADSKVFNILKPQKNSNYEDVYLVNDFFNYINFQGFSPYQIEKFFRSFLELNHTSISINLFDMVKADIQFYNNYYPLWLFNNIFLNQIMGEILMLEEDFKKACKSIAETIGKAFYKDIGLMSKFAYATDESMFKEYIEESFFLMAKRSALDSKRDYFSNKNELEIFFDGLTNENFKETKSYFVSFMSSYALYQKYLDNRPDSQGGN